MVGEIRAITNADHAPAISRQSWRGEAKQDGAMPHCLAPFTKKCGMSLTSLS